MPLNEDAIFWRASPWKHGTLKIQDLESAFYAIRLVNLNLPSKDWSVVDL